MCPFQVSAPLAKTDQIVLIGGGNNTTHVRFGIFVFLIDYIATGLYPFNQLHCDCLAGGEQVDGHFATSDPGTDRRRFDRGETRPLPSLIFCLITQCIMNSRSQFDGGSDLRNATASSPVQRVGSGMGLSNQLGPTAAAGGGDELAWSSISLTSSPSPHSSQAKPLSVGPLHLH